MEGLKIKKREPIVYIIHKPNDSWIGVYHHIGWFKKLMLRLCFGLEYKKNNKVMKANEAPKSKFVYPDKLYARTENNKTLDISYAPQTLEAVEYTRTDTFVEKACEWLENNLQGIVGGSIYIEDFRKYMEE